MRHSSARTVTIRVPGRTLVDDLDAGVYCRDALLVVLGRNGAGKSSLLHSLAGVNPQRNPARVLVDARPLEQWPRRELADDVSRCCRKRADDPFPGTALETVLVGRHPHIGMSGRWETNAQDIDMLRAVRSRRQTWRDATTARSTRCRAANVDGWQSLQCWRRSRRCFCSTSPYSSSIHIIRSKRSVLFRAPGRRGSTRRHEPARRPGLAARYADDAILLYGDGRWLHGAAA